MTNRALLIGINRYKIPGADRRGCVNDMQHLKGALPGGFNLAIETKTLCLGTLFHYRREPRSVS